MCIDKINRESMRKRYADCTHYTVVELKAIAKNEKVVGYSKMRKAELCEVLKIKVPAMADLTQYPVLITTQSKQLSPTRRKTSTTQISPSKKSSPRKTEQIVTKPCIKSNMTFPCKLKYATFVNEKDWNNYMKMKKLTENNTTISREEKIKIANADLEKEKRKLAKKTRSKPRVRFS